MPAMSFALPAFNDTGSLDSPPSMVAYPPGSMVQLWVTASRFLEGNKKAELKPTTFFHSYFSYLYSSPDPQRYSIFEYCLMELFL